MTLHLEETFLQQPLRWSSLVAAVANVAGQCPNGYHEKWKQERIFLQQPLHGSSIVAVVASVVGSSSARDFEPPPSRFHAVVAAAGKAVVWYPKKDCDLLS